MAIEIITFPITKAHNIHVCWALASGLVQYFARLFPAHPYSLSCETSQHYQYWLCYNVTYTRYIMTYPFHTTLHIHVPTVRNYLLYPPSITSINGYLECFILEKMILL